MRDVERIDLGRLPHAQRQRWRNGGEWDETAVKIAVGVLSDGRWYVERYRLGGEQKTLAYGTERLARGTARRWMRTIGGEWVEAGKL